MRLALSWSGGGIKALATLTWAEQLERDVGRPLHEVFDLVGGTSTGGIIAVALWSGHSVEKIKRFYLRRAPQIFSRSLAHRIRTMWGVRGPKYPAKNLDRALRGVLGFDQGFASAPEGRCRALVTAHELETGDLVDGGVHALNPVDSVLAQAIELWPDEPVTVIAVGHEPYPARSRSVFFKSWRYDVASDVAAYATAAAPTYFPPVNRSGMHDGRSAGWGLLEWGRAFPGAALEGSEHSSIWKAKRFIRRMPGSELFDIRPLRDLGPMDDASPSNLDRLLTLGQEMVREIPPESFADRLRRHLEVREPADG